MAGSLEHPLYRCLIKTKKANYNVSNLLTSLTTSQNNEELAQSVSITIPNIKDKNKYLYNNITVRDRYTCIVIPEAVTRKYSEESYGRKIIRVM